MRVIRLLIPALVALGSAGLAPANAQSPSPAPSAPTEQSPSIPDHKLDATAAAVKRVATLKQDYEQKLSAAPEAEKQRIANEANNALTKAVTDQGLSVEEYSSILNVAQSNPEVREKIIQRLRPAQ